MEISSKLKEARTRSKMTQEKVAEELQVSRQTISNWENGRSYPDIISVISLSDLYGITLDELLKGDSNMIKYLEESTNVVSSNKKLIFAVVLNCITLVLFIFFNGLIARNQYLMIATAGIAVIGAAALFYQIIKKF